LDSRAEIEHDDRHIDGRGGQTQEDDIIGGTWRRDRLRHSTANAINRGTSIVQDELALLARARKLDQDALAQIHDTYYTPIFRYVAFRVGDRHVAEDLTSEVFIRLLSALRDRTAPQNTLRGWLYGVAARVVSDHFRKHYRAPEVELDETLVSHDGNPAEVVEKMLTHEDLKQAVSQLTEEQQHVLGLRFGYNMPIQEVARALGKTEGAIKQLQARALAALARTMSPPQMVD